MKLVCVALTFFIFEQEYFSRINPAYRLEKFVLYGRRKRMGMVKYLDGGRDYGRGY